MRRRAFLGLLGLAPIAATPSASAPTRDVYWRIDGPFVIVANRPRMGTPTSRVIVEQVPVSELIDVEGICPVCHTPQRRRMPPGVYDMTACLECKNVFVLGEIPERLRADLLGALTLK